MSQHRGRTEVKKTNDKQRHVYIMKHKEKKTNTSQFLFFFFNNTPKK